MASKNDRNTRIRFLFNATILVGFLSTSALNAAVYNLHLVTDNTPDYTHDLILEADTMIKMADAEMEPEITAAAKRSMTVMTVI